MGAEWFDMTCYGETAQHAFDIGVEKAAYDYGHRGYTGTLAEKESFVMIDLPEGMTALEYSKLLYKNDDPRIADKWGPAGCIQVSQHEFLFFGWASA